MVFSLVPYQCAISPMYCAETFHHALIAVLRQSARYELAGSPGTTAT